MNIINEGKKDKKGCLMFNLKKEIKNWGLVTDIINVEDIYDTDTKEYGIETDPHITVLYGIDSSISKDEVKNFIKDKYNSKEIEVTLKEISLFENKEYDVVKIGIDSDDLVDLNNLLKENFPYESSFPDYKPHMTIAYVKQGEGKKYTKKLNEQKIKGVTFKYSIGSDDSIVFSLKK